MDTSYLKSFVLVAEMGSMAEAARCLNLTPAAIAQQIKALERELDSALITRSGRTVKPTQAGYRLLGYAKEVMRQLGEMKARVREDSVSGDLRLGTINTALHTILPEILKRLAATHPQVRVFIRSGLSHQLLDEVRQSELDLAICLHPEYVLAKSMIWQQLREEPLVLLVPQHLETQNPLELLRTQPFIRYDRSLGGGKQAERYLRKHGIELLDRFELSSLLAIAMMVHEGLGVSLVPDIRSPLTASLRITALRIHGMDETRRFGMLWQRGTARSQLITAFLDQTKTGAAL